MQVLPTAEWRERARRFGLEGKLQRHGFKILNGTTVSECRKRVPVLMPRALLHTAGKESEMVMGFPEACQPLWWIKVG